MDFRNKRLLVSRLEVYGMNYARVLLTLDEYYNQFAERIDGATA